MWDERVRHVEGLVAEAHVDVDVGGRMVCEPAGLKGDGTAGDGPVGAVGGRAHATACEDEMLAQRQMLKLTAPGRSLSLLTWIHPLHAVGERDVTILLVDAEHAFVDCAICDEIVAPPAGVANLEMCGGKEG